MSNRRYSCSLGSLMGLGNAWLVPITGGVVDPSVSESVVLHSVLQGVSRVDCLHFDMLISSWKEDGASHLPFPQTLYHELWASNTSFSPPPFFFFLDQCTRLSTSNSAEVAPLFVHGCWWIMLLTPGNSAGCVLEAPILRLLVLFWC